jgi:hypothetical protein
MENYQTSRSALIEIIGTLQHLSKDESHVHLRIGNRLLSFRNETKESDAILKNLSKEMLGKKIGILLTDLPNEPIIVRIITHNQSKVAPSKCQSGEGEQAQSHNLANLSRGRKRSESK